MQSCGNLVLYLSTKVTWVPTCLSLTQYIHINTYISIHLKHITIDGREHNANITHLELSGCRLTTLPREIGYLINLTSLDLWNCPLTNIPPEIGNLVNLIFKWLSSDKHTIGNWEFGSYGYYYRRMGLSYWVKWCNNILSSQISVLGSSVIYYIIYTELLEYISLYSTDPTRFVSIIKMKTSKS